MTARDDVALSVPGGEAVENVEALETLLDMVRSGVLNAAEFQEMVQMVSQTPNMDREDVVSLAAGTFEISRKELEKADLPNVELNIVKERLPGLFERRALIRNKYGEGIKDWFTGAAETIQKGGQALGDALSGTAEEKERREAVANEAISAIDAALAEGVISETKAGRLRKNVEVLQRDVTIDKRWNRLLDDIESYQEYMPGETQTMLEDIGQGLTGEEADEERIVAARMPPPVAAGADPYGGAGRPGEEGALGGDRYLPPSHEAPAGTLAEYMQWEKQGQLVPREMQEAIDIGTPVAGIESVIEPGEFWYDRSSGEVLSTEQYKRILTGEVMVAEGYMAGPGVGIGVGPVAEYFAAKNAPMTAGAMEIKQAYMQESAKAPVLPSYYGVDSLYGQEQVGTLAPFVDKPWEREAYHWQPGSARAFMDAMSTEERRKWMQKLDSDGLLNEYDEDGAYGTGLTNEDWAVGVTEMVLGVSQGGDIDPWKASARLGGFNQHVRDLQSAALSRERARLARATPVKQPFSVPAHLRAVPDAKAIAVDVKARFKAEVGRDPRPEELTQYADALDGYNRRSQAAQIQMAYDSWEGDDTVMDPGELEQVADPGKSLQYDITQDFASEINLNKRRETNADSFSKILNATRGADIGTPVTSRTNVVGRT